MAAHLLESRHEKLKIFADAKTKTQISCAVTAKLISQRLSFHYTDSTILFEIFKLLAHFCGCTDPFMSHLVGNTEDRFSRVAAPIKVQPEELEQRGGLWYDQFFFYYYFFFMLHRISDIHVYLCIIFDKILIQDIVLPKHKA